MVASIVNFLGQGCYTVREAAMYANSNPSLLSRWLYGEKAALPRQIDDSEDRFITFLDFVQTLGVRRLRKDYDVPLQRIRKAVDVLREQYSVEFPFARQHELFVYQQDVVYRRPSDQLLIQVSGKHVNQAMLRPVVQPHLRRLRFDDGGLASEYHVREDAGDGLPIVMRPTSRFGEPTMPSGYTAQTLYEAVIAEGSYERAAKEYDVEEREVRVAFEWYDTLPYRFN